MSAFNDNSNVDFWKHVEEKWPPGVTRRRRSCVIQSISPKSSPIRIRHSISDATAARKDMIAQGLSPKNDLLQIPKHTENRRLGRRNTRIIDNIDQHTIQLEREKTIQKECEIFNCDKFMTELLEGILEEDQFVNTIINAKQESLEIVLPRIYRIIHKIKRIVDCGFVLPGESSMDGLLHSLRDIYINLDPAMYTSHDEGFVVSYDEDEPMRFPREEIADPDIVCGFSVVADESELVLVTLDKREYMNQLSNFPEDAIVFNSWNHCWSMLAEERILTFQHHIMTDRRLSMMNIVRRILETGNQSILDGDSEHHLLQEIADEVVDGIYKLLNCDRVTLFIVDETRDEVFCLTSKDIEGFTVPRSKGLVGFSATTGDVLNIPDAYKDSRFNQSVDQKNGYHTRSVLCVPMVNVRGDVVGVIQALNKFQGESIIPFDDYDIEIIQEFNGIIDTTIQRASLREKSLYKLANELRLDGHQDMSSFISQFSKDILTQSMVKARRTLSRTSSVCSLRSLKHSSVTDKWDIDYFSLSIADMKDLALQIFSEFEEIEELNISTKQLSVFIDCVEEAYLPNPYHNFRHGFTVLHLVFMIISKSSEAKILRPIELFATLISALCHDVGHTGRNNSFEMNSMSNLAILYNDSSILENYHASLTFRIMKDEANILQNFNPPERRLVRDLIISAILKTDMTCHDELVQSLKTRISECPTGSDIFEEYNSDHRKLMIHLLLHSADIGVVGLPFNIFYKFSTELQKEFNAQVCEEKKMGLEYQPYMEPSDELSLARMQQGFINYVTTPLWNAVFEAFDGLDWLKDNMEDNLRRWEELERELIDAELVAAEFAEDTIHFRKSLIED